MQSPSRARMDPGRAERHARELARVLRFLGLGLRLFLGVILLPGVARACLGGRLLPPAALRFTGLLATGFEVLPLLAVALLQ